MVMKVCGAHVHFVLYTLLNYINHNESNWAINKCKTLAGYPRPKLGSLTTISEYFVDNCLFYCIVAAIPAHALLYAPAQQSSVSQVQVLKLNFVDSD